MEQPKYFKSRLQNLVVRKNILLSKLVIIKTGGTLKTIFIFLLSTFVISDLQAATYYVAKTGSDTDPNAGTFKIPFKTIARGSRQLNPGDTLYIREGTYDEIMDPNANRNFIFRNGTSTARTIYAAFPGEEKKVIVKPSTSVSFVVWLPSTATYIELRGMVFDGPKATQYVLKLDGTYDSGKHAKFIRIINNEFRNSAFGIQGGGDNQIIGNRFHNLSNYGIYSSFDNGIVEGNVFHDIGGPAIHHYKQDHTVNNWIFRNNTFFRNGRGYLRRTLPGLQTGPAVIISSGKDNQFYNNILYDNYSGVRIFSSAPNTFVAHNTIYNNDTFGIKVEQSSVDIVNNLIWANGTSQIVELQKARLITPNLTSDPKVINAAAGDFRLRPDSPAINRGTTLSKVKTDFTYRLRPNGAYDMGAYEYGANQAIPSAPANLRVGN